jgi:hypothetical protein
MRFSKNNEPFPIGKHRPLARFTALLFRNPPLEEGNDLYKWFGGAMKKDTFDNFGNSALVGSGGM